MNKTVAIVSGDIVQDILLRPGTTSHDVLSGLGLPDDYWVSQRDGRPFARDEVLYDQVQNGAKLFASPPASVAA